MLKGKYLPKRLWAEAVSTAVHVLNHTTHSGNHVRTVGSTACIRVLKQFWRKLDDKAKKMILAGYQGESCNYRLYDPVRKRVNTSRYVFNEGMHGDSLDENDSTEGKIVLPKTNQSEDKVIEVSDD